MEFSFDREFLSLMEKNNLQEVVILGHMNPDGDAAGSVMGLAHYIHRVYPQYKVYPYLSDKLDKGPKMQVLEDQVFHPFTAPVAGEHLTIVCDTATRERIIGIEYLESAAADMLIDHHRANEGYSECRCVRYLESCAENIYDILDHEKFREAAKEAYPNAADYIHMGILHDTDGFTRATAFNMKIIAEILEMGTDHAKIMKTHKCKTLEDYEKQALMLSMVEKFLDGNVAVVLIDNETREKYQISFEDIHPVSSLLRDCADIEVGLTLYEESPAVWRCSARSDGLWVDVNQVMKALGGGGHLGAAGLKYETEDGIKLKDTILDRINLLHKEEK